MADQKIIRKFSAETKALEDSRSLVVTITTDTPDRDGDVVVPKGGKFENFLKNPVVLFGHKYNEPFIARADELVPDDHDVKAKVTFPAKGIYPFADMLYELSKFLPPSWSIGFQPDMSQAEKLPGGGYRFNSWELLEFSMVPVPANPEARTILMSKGFTDEQIKEFTEQEPVAPEHQPQDESELVSQKDIADDDIIVELTGLDQKAGTYMLTATTKHGEQVVVKTLSAEMKALLLPPASETDPEALAKALTAIRDQLKPADKEIGLALRTLKSLLANPAK